MANEKVLIDYSALNRYHTNNVALMDAKDVATLKSANDTTTLAVNAEKSAREAADAAEVTARNEAIEGATTFENGITTVNALGGIPANTSLDGKSVTEILDMLLFPYVAPVITELKGSPNGGTYEKGNNQTITSATIKITKKSKAITKIELLNGSEVIATKEGDDVKAGGTFTFSGLSVPVNSTNVQLKVKVYDETGAAVTKLNAGSSDAATGSFTFVYPYYYGVCEAGAEVNEALVEGLANKKIESKGTKTWSFTTNNNCRVIAYPKAYGVLKTIKDPNGFDGIGGFTRSEVSVTGLDGTAQTYYVYVGGVSTESNYSLTFAY